MSGSLSPILRKPLPESTIVSREGRYDDKVQSLQVQAYQQAAHCYEEILMHSPQSIPLYIRYADVMYTLGGVHLKTARQYYAAALKLSNGHDLRALYGISCTAAALAGQKVGQSGLQRTFLELGGRDLLKSVDQAVGKFFLLEKSCLHTIFRVSCRVPGCQSCTLDLVFVPRMEDRLWIRLFLRSCKCLQMPGKGTQEATHARRARLRRRMMSSAEMRESSFRNCTKGRMRHSCHLSKKC